MKIPESHYHNIRCPHCGACSSIDWRESGRFWIAETCWTCPHCHGQSTTVELQDETRKVLAYPEQLK